MKRCSGFSLIELSVVLVILATLTGTSLTLAKKWMEGSEQETSQKFLSTIDKAIETYAKANGRLPCPGNITLTESSSNFGVEAASPSQATANLCQGGTPAAMNVGGEVMAGGVPTEALGLPKSMARDAWGNLIVYYVDRRMTLMDAFSIYTQNHATIGDITVNDLIGSNRTTKGIYAIVSHGANKYGGFDRTGVQANLTSTDTYEQENYDFDGNAGTAGDDRVLVQGIGSGTFDDLVDFRTRKQMMTASVYRSDACSGVWLGGYCWYLGNISETCDTVCATHAACNASATLGYAGSAGTNIQCNTVLLALSAGAGAGTTDMALGTGVGCHYNTGSASRIRDTSSATTCAAAATASQRRACACNN